MKGIDAAKWQGTINWPQVKAAGVEFAILKVIDKKCRTEEAFERNYEGAAAQGLLLGIYNYSYATTIKKAQSDAGEVLRALNSRKLQCKVWLDVEDDCQKGLGKLLIDIINEYKAVIENAGYEFGVYTGLSFYGSYIKPNADRINCPFWMARYPVSTELQLKDNPETSKKPAILHGLWGWQYTSKGSIPGISGNVDLNIMYADMSSGSQNMQSNPYQEPAYTLYRYRPQQQKEQVRWLQYELNEMDFGLAVDGIFGKATDVALRNAQKQLGAAADGKCGPITVRMLKNKPVSQ